MYIYIHIHIPTFIGVAGPARARWGEGGTTTRETTRRSGRSYFCQHTLGLQNSGPRKPHRVIVVFSCVLLHTC